jgi:hypothetical protein
MFLIFTLKILHFWPGVVGLYLSLLPCRRKGIITVAVPLPDLTVPVVNK